MGKRIRRYLMSVALLFWIVFCGTAMDVSAAVAEGDPGELLGGEYVVIVNTSTSEVQSTGTLIFDGAAGSSVKRVQDSSLEQDVAVGSNSLQLSASGHDRNQEADIYNILLLQGRRQLHRCPCGRLVEPH